MGLKEIIGALLLVVDASGAPTVEPQSVLKPGHGRIHGRIVDASTGQVVPCSVQVTDAQGRVHTDSPGFTQGFRSSGEFERELPAGRTRIRVTRGFEYAAVEREVSVEPGITTRCEVMLRRQVDLRSRGWYSGDHHAHVLHGERTVPVSFDEVALAAKAEDLQALSLAQAWPMDVPTPERLDQELNARSAPDCHLTWNLEAPKNYLKGDAGRCLGHCWTLALNGRTPSGTNVIAALLQASAWDYESDKPSYANFESHALIHAQGGAVFYTHPARWWTGPWGGSGGYPRRLSMRISNMAVELPLDTLIGPTFDGLDVITGAGEAAADEKAFQLWSMLLNHGYRVAATASSDACFDRPGGAIPGSARLYVQLEEPFSLRAVARAAARGRTLATTGPLVLCSVDGKPPGTAFAADGVARSLRIEAWPSGASTGALDRVEICRNGTPWQHFDLSLAPVPWVTNIVLAPEESAWFAVRAFGADRRRQRAVTGAFFFDAEPWQSPKPETATLRVRVLSMETGEPIPATLTELRHLGPEGIPGTSHSLAQGDGVVAVPGTSRVRASAPGYEPAILSPFFDHPALLETIASMDDQSLLDWNTFERIRELLREVPLTFRLRAQP